MIQSAIARVVEGKDLPEREMMEVMEQITEGKATQAQIGALLIGLRMKGESVEEISAAAHVMRSKSIRVPIGQSEVCLDRDEINVDRETIVDTCGTGGDGTRTFNVSTTTAFVVAGAGLKVAKHGNRSVSSRCGSADVVEALGVPLDLTPQQVGECIDRVGIGFLYAPLLHGAMRHVIGPRREIGLRTIFNVLGPLTNPAGATVQVLGVYRQDLTETLARVLGKLGCRSAFVVYGAGSYDEISISGPTTVTRLLNGKVKTETVCPEDVGLNRARPEDILGGDATQNAAITLSVLSGERGPQRDMVLLNSSAALVAADLVETLAEGVRLAAQSIDSLQAKEKLHRLVSVASELSAKNCAVSA
ncbi:MAG: anthranilate phosphoribosyltransferase [Desulfomonile tiedjei]|nr:anthranilate phosphoribosyltransferase [Desulfomonile tiedjei]